MRQQPKHTGATKPVAPAETIQAKLHVIKIALAAMAMRKKPKMAPRPLQDDLKATFWMIFIDLGSVFYCLFCDFLLIFELFVGDFWSDFNILFVDGSLILC